jgi:cobalt/nickel transport system permease protein
MHIHDGLLDTPVCLVTGGISLAAVGYSVHRLKDSLADRTVPMTGMVAALVFAGQMINFPVTAGTSGHLIGGVLAARLLGPWAGCLALTLVLFVQKFLFNDGGLLALGPNVLHMAVIGSLGGYAIQSAVARLAGDTIRGRVIGVVVASWFTVMAAAVLCSIEFAISQATNPDFQLGSFLALMMLFHSLIGIGESLISGGVIRFVATRRPELLYNPPASSGRPWRRTLAAGLATAVVVALLLSPLASSAPDGLEAAVQHSGLRADETPSLSLFGGYDQVLGDDGWESWSVVLSGLIGTLVVFGIALVLGRPLETTPNPAPGAPRG